MADVEKGLDTQIDRLFQLPLAEFTAARNALARQAGADGAAIKALSRPPVAAWAVNQLYFRDQDTYDALVAASTELRQTHKAVLEGRKADLRSATREHDLALDAAVKRTVALMQDAGQPVTDTTRHAIVNTLRALPSDDPPGRLTRTLAPGGFEVLAGISLHPGGGGATTKARKPDPAKSRHSRRAPAAKASTEDKEAQEAARERERRAAAERALRDAEHHARQAEFAAARAAREAAKATERLERARHDFDQAKTELEQAQAAAKSAGQTKEAAERQLRDAGDEVQKARQALGS